MPPEIQQAFDRIENLNSDPSSTNADLYAAVAEFRRVAEENDPQFAGAIERNLRRIGWLLRAEHN
jgi:hypothetical protein